MPIHRFSTPTYILSEHCNIASNAWDISVTSATVMINNMVTAFARECSDRRATSNSSLC
jgi:hypothetical protein